MLSINIVFPVYNEEDILEDSVEETLRFLGGINNVSFRLTVADNGSTDGTLEKARSLKRKHQLVDVIHIDERGRGRALRNAWSSSREDIVGYMDVDLSTKLDALEVVLDSFKKGFDVVIGSRLVKGSVVERSFLREFLSRFYNSLLKIVLDTKFKDAQCGFKFLEGKVARKLLPLVGDNEWFFDTELLTKAEWLGYSIKEVPVTWVERGGSKVKIVETTLDYVKNTLRVRGEKSGFGRLHVKHDPGT